MSETEKHCVQCGGSLPSVFNYCPEGQRPGKPSIRCHGEGEAPSLPPLANPEREHIEQFFEYAHLPLHLQEISKPFADHVKHLIRTLPKNPERTVALRKLLEAKDAAIRAKLAK